MPPKPKNKTFLISESYHLYKVDKWWAGLLRQGAKEIIATEWEALGMLRWKLRITWSPITDDVKLNVGHPDYADFTLDELKHQLLEALDTFEAVYHDFNLLEKRVVLWQLSETPGDDRSGPTLSFRADLDDVDKMIALEYVWPEYKNLRKACSFLTIQLRELEAEIKARDEADYFAVKVDRGMLRESFNAQIGYDNDFIFEEVEFLPPDALD